MGWKKHFNGFKKRTHYQSTPVAGLADIPDEASSDQSFRLTVHVLQIVERITKNDNPFYFLNVRDAAGVSFSIVCWEWQMDKLRTKVTEGETVELNVRVPGDGYQAFTLA